MPLSFYLIYKDNCPFCRKDFNKAYLNYQDDKLFNKENNNAYV